jgi:peptidoglycan/xylan/chitin deacetylase (PgdA/CDA1 family)
VNEPEKFEAQVKYLIEKFNIISLTDLQDHLFNNKDLPPRPLLITFDDGDISVLQNGLPILKKYKLPSVLFVITQLIDSENMFWCRQVEAVFKNKGKSYQEARQKIMLLKKKPNSERLKYLDSLEAVKCRQLTSDELHVLQNDKMFIGNHTHTHPMINNCTEFEIEQELEKVKTLFQKWNLEGYPIFAYPNGNWDAKSEKILVKNGVQLAFLFDHQINKKSIDPLRISRITVDSDTEINEFKVKVSGLHSKILSLKNSF